MRQGCNKLALFVVVVVVVVVEFRSIPHVEKQTLRRSTGVKTNLLLAASSFEPLPRAETTRNPRDSNVPSRGAKAGTTTTGR